jgi:hypothetical protein
MMIHLILALAVLAALPPDITTLLPADGTPDGWSRSGDSSLYEGGALFEYVNGGADAYHDRGFERLVAQLYSKGDAEVQLEIYDMGSPKGAKSIFAENSTGMDTTTGFGERSTRDEYQISFFRGRYYVSVLAFSSGDATGEAMVAIAEATDEAIQGE